MSECPQIESDSIPLDQATLAALPTEQQDILKAFFAEADAIQRNPSNLQGSANDNLLTPPESLQFKYDTIMQFGGNRYCPVKQRINRFAFKETGVTVH